MWRERILTLAPGAEPAAPATERALAGIPRALGQPLPEALAALLRECDGVRDEDGTDVVWSAARIAADNAAFRSSPAFAGLYMPFEPLLFFGDDGGGDQFAFVRVPRREEDVFVWEHETDSRTWAAAGLDDYLRRVLGG
ncbi:SMI1/KNR4 family protein [Streptomyces sp. PU-14G]|uniref:SMI1/KNR4 family protein n=1 Tax=Streptomyces sp. PU-14G TaxID=2800808 RepID=UPI0034DE6799